MKSLSALVMIVLVSAFVWAQTSEKPSTAKGATISGVVSKEPGSEPVKKALIELIADTQGEGGDYTAISAVDGSFFIEGVVPGHYRLFAERVGMLEIDKHRASNEGRLLTLTAGQELTGIQIRLQAAAVVHGRVTDEDGDPLPNAQVGVLHQTYSSGRSKWEQVGAERTNDLGEYRVANLAPGTYCVSVTPPPDTRSIIESANMVADLRAAMAPEKSASSYQTTYYPGTTDRAQASSIQLHAGDEFPVNFSLTPSPTLTIRGSVINLPPRATAAVVLQSRDFNFIVSAGEIHKDGSFVIRDVAPGGYTIMAMIENAPVAMTARQSLQVVSSMEGVRLSPQPGADIRGRLRLDAKGNVGSFDPTQIFLMLHSADGDDDSLGMVANGFSNLAHVEADGSVMWHSVPPGNYYVDFVGDNNASSNWFLKTVLAGGRDADAAGISVNGGSVTLDLVASANGASVDGIAIDGKGDAVANAVIVAVPDQRFRSRLDRYRKTVTDQTGHFSLKAFPPGDYTVLAWESVEGEAYYNPEFVRQYEPQGAAVHLSEGEHKMVEAHVIADGETQP